MNLRGTTKDVGRRTCISACIGRYALDSFLRLSPSSSHCISLRTSKNVKFSINKTRQFSLSLSLSLYPLSPSPLYFSPEAEMVFAPLCLRAMYSELGFSPPAPARIPPRKPGYLDCPTRMRERTNGRTNGNANNTFGAFTFVFPRPPLRTRPAAAGLPPRPPTAPSLPLFPIRHKKPGKRQH